MKIDGALFLNDLATAPDGTIYVSDSTTLRIYRVRNGKASVFVEGGDASSSRTACWWTAARLILGTVGPAPQPGGAGRGRGRARRRAGHLFAFDLKTKQRTQVTNEPVGGIDGIELDGSGGLLVTDVIGARLLQVAKSGQVKVLAKFSAGGADFGYIAAQAHRGRSVPFENRVAAYDLTTALK